MPIISQNLVVPPGLQVGGQAHANQITPLWNALNAFSIPDAVASAGASLLVQDSAVTTTVLSPNTAVTHLLPFSPSVPRAEAAILASLAFSYTDSLAGGQSFRVTFEIGFNMVGANGQYTTNTFTIGAAATQLVTTGSIFMLFNVINPFRSWILILDNNSTSGLATHGAVNGVVSVTNPPVTVADAPISVIRYMFSTVGGAGYTTTVRVSNAFACLFPPLG